MAWQLIYTSAPRLIEAGRTGFGTVARHRAVSGMLASAVERFSQFARLPGHDPRRVVHAHRILTDIEQPWMSGFRRPLFWQDFWQYVDIDGELLARQPGKGS